MQEGSVKADFPESAGHVGEPARMYAAGLVTVDHGVVVRGRIIRNRLDFVRSLKPA